MPPRPCHLASSQSLYCSEDHHSAAKIWGDASYDNPSTFPLVRTQRKHLQDTAPWPCPASQCKCEWRVTKTEIRPKAELKTNVSTPSPSRSKLTNWCAPIQRDSYRFEVGQRNALETTRYSCLAYVDRPVVIVPRRKTACRSRHDRENSSIRGEHMFKKHFQTNK